MSGTIILRMAWKNPQDSRPLRSECKQIRANDVLTYTKTLRMKRILFAAIPVAAVAILFAKPVIDPLPIGSAIPKAEVKMKDISGKEVSLKETQKKNGLLVMFSCNTCPYVIKNQSP